MAFDTYGKSTSLGMGSSVQGMKELNDLLQRLEPKIQKRALRPALRDSAKRIKSQIVQNLSGGVVGVRTGTLRRAYRGAKIRASKKGRRGGVTFEIWNPTRTELRIKPGAPGYYPFAMEYGTSKLPAKRFIRDAVDNLADGEIRKIAMAVRRVLTTTRA